MFKYICIIVVSVCFVFSPASSAKKRCKPLLEKLRNIQSLQRSGYSQKKGVSLRKREDNARDKWWQCENGRAKKEKNNTKGSAKASNRKNKKNSNSAVKRKIVINDSTVTPFKTTDAVVIKSKYHGEKKRAWLTFYQQPEGCSRPKNLAVFASCSENKQKQRADFEKSYAK